MEKADKLSTEHILSHYDPAVLQMHAALKMAEESNVDSKILDAMRYALNLVDMRETFSEDVTTDQSKPCKEIFDNTYSTNWDGLKAEGKVERNLPPRMITGHLEGQFLKSMVSIQNAKRVLEVGMYTGYSALSMAEALPADGQLVTVDINPYLEEHTGNLLKKSPHGSKIKIHIGSAMDYMTKASERGETFDLIFLDADKSEYGDYLKIAISGNLLSPRGTILVDNAFNHGGSYFKENPDHPGKKFAKILKADPTLHVVNVPLRDGVTMVRRLTDVEGETAK